MKKCLVVLTGIMALMLFVPAASASYILCGAATSGGNGNTGLQSQPVTFTCPGITIAANTFLTSVNLQLVDDAQGPSGPNVAVNWTWSAFTGVPALQLLGNQVNTEQANAGGTSFNPCYVTSAAQTGDTCGPTTLTFSEPSIASSFNAVSVTVSAAPEGVFQAGVGGDSASLWIQYNYSSGLPEPATFGLLGGALLGLGIFGSKKFSRR